MIRAANRSAYRRSAASRAAQTFVLACALLVLSATTEVARSQQLPAIQRQVPPWGATRLPGDVPDTAHSTRRDGCLRIGEAEILLPVPDPGDTLKLSHRLVSPCQLRVTQDGTAFQVGCDYLLDPVAGELFWLGARPARASPLRVRYRYLPLAIAGYWERVRWAASPETLAIADRSPEPELSLPPGARLQVGGSKTFSLEFGNRQDVDFSQSLDLTIRGQLAEQVKIRAILTDRNMPLQPEGTTAELTDLDQVLVEVTSPWGELRLGDLSVREEGFCFLAHQREMEGLLLSAGRPGRGRGAGAVGRGIGQARSRQFFGENGKQGPYQLLPNKSSIDALMVAGSERIWLDGMRLRRGEDADYSIDYSSAEVWFTSRHPITAVSEMRVDFQVREGAFERDYYWLSAGAGDTKTGLAAAWLREQDDLENSRTLSLNAEERAALAEAGDSATAALEGGVHWVGPGEGPYELMESDTLETEVFLYLGEQDGVYLGSYEVTFSSVGEGNGDYRDSTLVDGAIIYVYAGRKQGTHLPGRQLPLPEARDLLALRAGGDLGGGLNLSAESAVSWHDRNILSSRDDGDNVGAALTTQGTWGLAELIGGQRDWAQLRFRYRGVQQEFSSSEPLDEAFYYRRWNAPAEILDGRDQRGALGLRLRPWKSVALDGELERLEAPKGFSGRRWHLLGQRTGRLHALAELWLGQSRCDGKPGTEQRRRARLGWSDQVELEACYDAEDLRRGDKRNEQGESYEQLSLKLASGRLAPWLYASALTRMRWDYERDDGEKRSEGFQRLYQVEGEVSGAPAYVHLIYACRVSEDPEGNELSRSDVADWTLSYKGLQRLFKGEWRGKLTSEESALRTEKLLYVGAEVGHYDSLGQYVGVGDYELYYARGDTIALETRLDTAMRLTVYPLAPLASEGSLLRDVETSLYGKVKMATPDPLGVLMSDLGQVFKGDAPTSDRNGLLRVELTWKGGRGWPTPTLRGEQRRRTERSTSGFARTTREGRGEMEVRYKFRQGLQARMQLTGEKERRNVTWDDSPEMSSTEELIREWISAEGRWRFLDPFSARVGVETGREDVQPSGSRRTFTEATLGGATDLKRKGRIELTWERRWVSRSGKTSAAFTLERPGWKLTLNGSLRPWAGITTSLWVRVERREGQQQVITGRCEARAFF